MIIEVVILIIIFVVILLVRYIPEDRMPTNVLSKSHLSKYKKEPELRSESSRLIIQRLKVYRKEFERARTEQDLNDLYTKHIYESNRITSKHHKLSRNPTRPIRLPVEKIIKPEKEILE